MSWDVATYERLFRERYGDLVRFGHGFTNSRMAAEDLAQEALVRLWNRGPTARPDADRWLFRVVRNAALDWLKTERRRLEREAASSVEYDDHAFGEGDVKEVRAVVQSLPDRSREVLLLQVYGGMSLAEISNVVGRSTNVVKQDLFRARERLRRAWYEKHGVRREG